MSNIWLIYLLILVGMTGCKNASRVEQTKLTKEEVRETIRTYDDAWRQKDTAAVGSIQAQDYIYFSSKGGTRSRQWILNNLLGNPAYKINDLLRSEITITLHSNTAIVGSRWQGTGNYGEQPVNDDQRCSQVFVEKKGHLYLVSEHCTDINSN